MSNWFMLEVSEERIEETQEQLTEQGVVFSSATIQIPREITGISFPEEERDRVFEILGIPEHFCEVGTDLPGVFFLEDANARVVVFERNGWVSGVEQITEWRDAVEPVLVEYAERLGIKISVLDVHGPKSPEIMCDPEMLYIRLHTAPKTTGNRDLGQVFGLALEQCHLEYDRACNASNEGVALIDSAGVTVGDLVGGTLFLHFDLACQSAAAELMQKVMESYIEIAGSLEDRKRIREEYLAEELIHSEEAYIRECGKRRAATIKSRKDEIENEEQYMERAMQNIARGAQKIPLLREQLAALEANTEPDMLRFRQEFKKLVEIPEVQRVQVQEERISVFTESIEVEHEGGVYALGKFRISIFPNGKNGGVRFRNLTRRVNDYDHPHIYGGDACFGNISTGVAKLVATYEYAALTILLINYLQAVNPHDWHISVLHWPKKQEEVITSAE